MVIAPPERSYQIQFKIFGYQYEEGSVVQTSNLHNFTVKQLIDILAEKLEVLPSNLCIMDQNQNNLLEKLGVEKITLENAEQLQEKLTTIFKKSICEIIYESNSVVPVFIDFPQRKKAIQE